MAVSDEAIPVLPEDVPVTMPDLPPRMVINTTQHYKAMGDPTRVKILGIIQHQPATAKQLADRLGIAPGTAGHHLQTLEAAGLAQVVARRMVRGIVAKYYTRTARLFVFERPIEGEGGEQISVPLDLLAQMRDELVDALAEADKSAMQGAGFPHARLTEARAKEFADRLQDLIAEFAQEPSAPDGKIYGMGVVIFQSPRYLQVPDDVGAAIDQE